MGVRTPLDVKQILRSGSSAFSRTDCRTLCQAYEAAQKGPLQQWFASTGTSNQSSADIWIIFFITEIGTVNTTTKYYKSPEIAISNHQYQVPSISTSARWFQRCGDAPTALRLALRRALGWSQIFPEGGTTWGRTSGDPPELLVFGSPIWVCLKMSRAPKTNG